MEGTGPLSPNLVRADFVAFATYRLPILRATSHMRPRARDHYTPTTLIGGKGGAGPSSLHTTLH